MTNDEFVARWRDVWFVLSTDGAGGIGQYSAEINGEGSVLVKGQMDWASRAALKNGYPEKADKHLHIEWELVLTDVNRFDWTSYRITERASQAELFEGGPIHYQDSHLICPKGWSALTIVDETGEESEIDATGGGPIVPDFHLALYAATRPHDKADSWPVRFLSFDRGGAKRRWLVWQSSIRYAGRKGPTTGLSHTFESEDVGDGRVFSVWVDENGRFIGSGDEREVWLVAADEATARAFLVAAI